MDDKLVRRLQRVWNKLKLNAPFFIYDEIHQGNVNHMYRMDYIHNDGTGIARIKNYPIQFGNTDTLGGADKKLDT